jgi:hypothetical protein
LHDHSGLPVNGNIGNVFRRLIVKLDRKSIWRWALSPGAAFIFALSVMGSAQATSVREVLLDEIIDTSAVAFHGVCTDNRVDRDSITNLVVTYTTFDVKDVIKGNANATHVIKQIGGVMPAGDSGFRVHGVPKFAVGEEYVVFLAGVSSAGFSSPIGLSQGKFSVQQSTTGKTVSNGTDFRVTTSRMKNVALPSTGAPANALGLDAFKQMARTHANKLQ